MNKYGHVGIKVGWICAESSKQLNSGVSPLSLKHWDELKFDRWCQAICKDSAMQYLYTKAGLKQSDHNKSVNVSEGCPYTAYPRDQRYIVQTQGKKDIRTICPIQKRVAAHWKGVAEVCSSLAQARLVHCTLLPEDCIKKSNAITTVYNMLNHWANPPTLPSTVICNDSVSDTLSNCSYPPTLEDSYMPFRIAEITDVVTVDKPKPRQKCILL